MKVTFFFTPTKVGCQHPDIGYVKLKRGRLLDTFIEEATKERQSKEHCMCIKQTQQNSSQSLLRNQSTLKTSSQFVCPTDNKGF